MGTWLKSNRDKCSVLYEVKYLSILSNHKTNKQNKHPHGLGLDSCHHDTLLTFWTTMEKLFLVSSVQSSQRPPEKIGSTYSVLKCKMFTVSPAAHCPNPVSKRSRCQHFMELVTSYVLIHPTSVLI